MFKLYTDINVNKFFQVRHNVRPHFLQSPAHKQVYDVITWAATQIAICYTVVPFVLLSVGPSIKFYRSVRCRQSRR